MELITVHTTQNIDIDHEIGGLGERIVAVLIDIAVFIPFLITGMIIAPSLTETASAVYFFVLLFLYVFYDLVFEVFFNGQSIGKRVMKIRVISADGSRPRFSQYLLRWLFRLVDFPITGYVCGLISAAITEKGQRVGDLVAGTVLIRTVPRTKSSNIIFAVVEDGYQLTFPQVSQLTDKDLALIHDVIETYFATGGNNLVYQMADKVRSHLTISVPPNMNSLQFLQTISKDYSHLTAQADMG